MSSVIQSWGDNCHSNGIHPFIHMWVPLGDKYLNAHRSIFIYPFISRVHVVFTSHSTWRIQSHYVHLCCNPLAPFCLLSYSYWPLHDFYRLASLPAKEAACQLLEKAGVKEWECGRTKIFLKFCNSEKLEECTRDISRKAVIMQKCTSRNFSLLWLFQKWAFKLD